MKVNMTPNPLDVVTIHASQGDTEARQWEFELHNNGELIDTSDVKEQLVFKAYKGGTEQILPENGAVPVTAPFVGDIKYPDATRNDQEFLYRQSPTEEDGLAKITDVKGNTLVWNQIFIPQNRNGSGIQANVIQDGNGYSVRIYGTATANAWLRMDATGTLPVGHKFLLDKGSTSDLFDINNDDNGLNVDFSAKSKIGTVTTANKYIYIYVHWGTTIDVTVKPMLIDLTAMFGSGNEPSTVEEFTSLFGKPYYDYCQGVMLSFGGRNVKFNQVAPSMSSSMWVANSCTKTVSGNTFSLVGTNNTSMSFGVYIALTNLKLTVNHNYLFMCVVNPNRGIQVRFTFDRDGRYTTITPNQDNVYSRVVSTATEDPVVCYINHPSSITTSDTVTVKNLIIVDLTEMFGAGNEPSAEGFRELFPNDYYEYNVGQYMNLGQPVSLKTVSKNQFNVNDANADNYVTLEKSNGKIRLIYDGANAQRYRGFYMYRTEPYVNGRFLPKQYTVSFDVVGIDTTWVFGLRGVSNNTFDAYQRVTFNVDGHYSFTFNPSELTEDYYLSASRTGNKTTAFDITFSNIQIEIGTETEYEPFEESALSIPLNEFPDGMDGVNDARDEKNETWYVKRIGRVDLGTLTYVREAPASGHPDWPLFYASVPNALGKYGTNGNTQICAKYSNRSSSTWQDKTIGFGAASTNINIADTAFADYTVEQVKEALSGVMLYYVLQTPLENYGVVDLGSLAWTYDSGTLRFVSSDISLTVKKPLNNATVANILCANYSSTYLNNIPNVDDAVAVSTGGVISIKDATYTDATAFKTAMSGVYLLFEKENPQGFTTATLVTENGDVALANENGVLVGKCNSDVSADAGFIEGKIKLSDEDGDVYSNKIQIHVERSPQ